MSDNNELIESLKAWSEHFTPKNHPVALTLNRARADLTAAKQQLDEVTAERNNLNASLTAAIGSANARHFEAMEHEAKSKQLERELNEVTKQRDGLKEALEEIATGAWCIKTCVDAIAPRALAQVNSSAVKGGES